MGAKHAKGLAQAQLDKDYLVRSANWANTEFQEEKVRELKDRAALDDYKFRTGTKEATEIAQMQAYERSNEVADNNLKSLSFYTETARDRVNLGLDEQIAELSFQFEDLERDFTRKAVAAAFGDAALEQTLDNARQDAELKKKELKIEKANATAEFDAKLGYINEQGQKIAGQFDIESRKVQSENRYNQLNNQLDSIIQKGAAQARGLKGRGANKMTASIAALSGLNTQRLSDSLYLAEQSIGIQKELTKKQKLSILGDKTAKKGSASYLGALGIQKKQIKTKLGQTKRSVKLQQKEIAETLGIDAEEFELSKEKLGESLMSVGESAKIKLEEIEAKAFEAKTQIHAQRMLKPVFGPDISVPFATPKTEYIRPFRPIYPTEHTIKQGAGITGSTSTPSTLSTALGIGSTVASLASLIPGAAPVAAPVAAGLGFLSDLFR